SDKLRTPTMHFRLPPPVASKASFSAGKWPGMEPNWSCRVEAVQGLSDQRRLIRSPPPIGPRSVAGNLFWGIAGEAAIHGLVARSCIGLKIGRTFATQADRNRQWSLTVEGAEDPCF